HAMLRAFGFNLPTTSLQLHPRTVIVSLVVGTIATLVSSFVPAMRASRVAPLAAIRDAESGTAAHSARRTATGTVVAGLGAAALGVGLFGHPSNAVGLGAALVFLGIAMLSPLVARPV